MFFLFFLLVGALLCRIPWPVFGVSVVATVAAAVLIVSLSTYFSYYRGSNNQDSIYSSRDTGLVEYSSPLCDHLSIRGSGFSSDQVIVTLYLLKSIPTDTKKGSIYLSRKINLENNYQFWYFHLLPESRIEINACVLGTSSATFFLIKGVKRFGMWVKDGSRHYEKRISVTTECKDELLTYDVDSDDQYYLAFETNRGSASLNIISITQILYAVTPDIVENNCSVPLASDESCAMPISFSSNFKVLLQLEPTAEPIDWEANNVVHVNCHVRAWFFTVMCLCAAVGGALLMVSLAVFLFVMYQLGKKKKNRKTSSSNTATGVTNLSLPDAETSLTTDKNDF